VSAQEQRAIQQDKDPAEFDESFHQIHFRAFDHILLVLEGELERLVVAVADVERAVHDAVPVVESVCAVATGTTSAQAASNIANRIMKPPIVSARRRIAPSG
jgi:hypothetical protein